MQPCLPVLFAYSAVGKKCTGSLVSPQVEKWAGSWLLGCTCYSWSGDWWCPRWGTVHFHLALQQPRAFFFCICCNFWGAWKFFLAESRCHNCFTYTGDGKFWRRKMCCDVFFHFMFEVVHPQCKVVHIPFYLCFFFYLQTNWVQLWHPFMAWGVPWEVGRPCFSVFDKEISFRCFSEFFLRHCIFFLVGFYFWRLKKIFPLRLNPHPK